MRLVYKFALHKKDVHIDALCKASNNLYNQANYLIKQELTKNGKWLRYSDLDKIMKVTSNLEGEINYKKLKAQCSQQILRLLDKGWISYFRSLKDFKNNPKKYKGQPKPPNYKKRGDRNILIFTNQNSQLVDGKIVLDENISIGIPRTDIDFSKFQQIRILPRKGCYEIEIIYSKDCTNFNLDPENYLSVDLGVDNLISCLSKTGSFLLDGKTIKSVNQFFNKMKAQQQSFKDKKGDKECLNKMNSLSLYRHNFIKDQFHKMTRLITNYCIVRNIGTIVCGYNTRWKDSTDMGRVNNQKFVHVPHKLLLRILKYKCELVGIKLVCNEESYTSKCDGLALEPVKKHKKYLGKRAHRGLFQSSVGRLINADINGALNTLRKVIGDGSFIRGLVDSVVLFNPVKIRFTDLVSGQTLSNLLVRC